MVYRIQRLVVISLLGLTVASKDLTSFSFAHWNWIILLMSFVLLVISAGSLYREFNKK